MSMNHSNIASDLIDNLHVIYNKWKKIAKLQLKRDEANKNPSKVPNNNKDR